jgi:biopolymer transport protein TolR
MVKKSRRKRRVAADLNLTNLIDVIFALLIIFMITAPMMTQGVQVDLPKAEAENVETDEDVIQVSVTAKNKIYINDNMIPLNRFSTKFANEFAGRLDVPVYINADADVPYGIVIRVIAMIQKAGVVKLGFLTEPLEKES